MQKHITQALCERGLKEDTRAILEEAILFLTGVTRAGHTEEETFGWALKKWVGF